MPHSLPTRALFLGLATCLLGVHAAFAQSHSALDFDGVDDLVDTGSTLHINGPLTLEAWVFARPGTGGDRIISNRNGSNGYELDISHNALDVQLRFVLNASVRASGDFSAHLNAWTHVAAVFEGATTEVVRLYINGVQVNSGLQFDPIGDSSTNLTIGRQAGGGFFFDGMIDEVRVWDAALDQPTIMGWMSSHVAGHPNMANLVGSWTFDEESGQTVASEVNSPANDGRLGSTAGVDADDPTWVTSGVVPVREISLGGLKSRYRNAPRWW